jgi:FAD/FMN-containing dehydrogenase
MISSAVKTFSSGGVKFAIRGGGSMPVSNAANIGPEGILISSSNLTTMKLSQDHQIVSVGPGIRFPTLYTYLEPYNVTVNGIRIGDVGVAGFILGGGIGFFSYEHGLASTGVDGFEVSLFFGNNSRC